MLEVGGYVEVEVCDEERVSVVAVVGGSICESLFRGTGACEVLKYC